MAILNKIRQRSLFLIIIIALALFSFVLADVFKNGGFDSSKQSRVATINGENIDREDFARKVEQQSRRLGPSATSTRSVNTVWDQEVNRVVLEGQYEELGVAVGRDRLNELLKNALQNDQRFQDADGFFSEGKMQEFIATLKESNNPDDYASWITFEESLADTEKQNIYYNLVKAGLGATLKDGEVAYKLEGNSVDIQFVQVPYTTIPDEDVDVSKEEISSYIATHSDEFQTEATRSIRYVKFDEKATLDDENALKADVAKLLEDETLSNGVVYKGFKNTDEISDFIAENSERPFQDRFVFKNQLPAVVADSLYALEKGDVFGPYKDGNFMRVDRVVETRQMQDSVKSRHILVSYQGALRSPETRTEEEAKTLADSILGVVKRDKKKFDELALAFSSDNSNKAKGGDLDYQNPNLYAEEFRDFIVDNRVGALDVVKTDFGYHVIEVTDQKNKQKALKIATVTKEIVPSDKTISEVYNTTQKFEIAANAGDFSEVAKENGYTVRPVNSMRAMEENLPGEGSQRSIVQWSFEEDTKVGDVKKFQVNNGYIVAQVTAKRKKGLQKTEDVSGRVTPIVRNQKKAAKIITGLTGETLDAIASSQNQTVKTAGAINMSSTTIAGAGNEPKVVGAAFGLKEGEVSDPVEGNRGVYVVKVTKVSEAPVLDNYAAKASQEAAKARAGVNVKVLAALKEAAEIEDNRATFY